MTLEELKEALVKGILGSDQIKTFPIQTEDWQKIKEMAQARYHKWEWNIGGSPRFTVNRQATISAHTIQVDITISKGHIESIVFVTSSELNRPFAELAHALQGAKYDRRVLSQTIMSSRAVAQTKVDISEVLHLIY